jgi:P-type Cu2+ transporter
MSSKGASHHHNHENMIKDFKKRFWISLVFTIVIFILSPTIQKLFSYNLSIPYLENILFILSSIIFFYGGWPFLKGSYFEIKSKLPGMMTLIAFAIIVAYIYSTSVVFGLKGKYFFWEISSLITIMLR